MFPPEIIPGTFAAPFNTGVVTNARETERKQSEQQWRLSADHQESECDAQLSSSPSPLMAVPLRRVHSQYTFRFSEEVNLISEVGSPATGGSFERVQSGKDEDDHNLLASYMDLEKIEGMKAANQSFPTISDDDWNRKDDPNEFRRCHSVDDMCRPLIDGNGDGHGNKKTKDKTCEVKKAMSPDKLAELWVHDPKRAKRILANRQSAARSKERKARYIVELEKKVQSLRTEATALSVQLSLFERDTSGLTNENTELRHQLDSMEQHAELRDALIDALKRERDRLKAATGEATSVTETFIMPVQNIPQIQVQSQTQPQQPQTLVVDSYQPKLQPLYPFDSSMANPKNIDLHRPTIQHLPSFEGNIPFNEELDSPKTKKPRVNPPEPALASVQQVVDPSNVKSELTHTFDSNSFNFPQPQEVSSSSVYPVNKGLYLPLDSSKPRIQFCTSETNNHGSLQPTESLNHGFLTQDGFEPSFLNSNSQWVGPGRSGVVPVGYWGV